MIKSIQFLRTRFFSICFLLGCFVSSLFAANQYNLIPLPQELVAQSGSFKFNRKTRILCPTNQPELLKLARQFSEQFALVSGISMPIMDMENANPVNAIVFQQKQMQSAEAYSLQVSPKTIRIEAQAANGFFYGLQTLYQLLPPEIYGKKKMTVSKWSVPAVLINDAPRFAYRGLHLDVSRHFFPIEFVKKYIDAMAIHKLNTFHWHLTDDQGWRIEIKKYPLLTEIGSKRSETIIGNYFEHFPQKFDGKEYSGFYTQVEAREIVDYAAERFITVIPEIEMPGHAQAAIAAYPQLSCTLDPEINVATRWGIFDDVFCPRETTFEFLEDVLTEVLDVFPSTYIHIGGDECPKTRWKVCPDCQALIKNLNLKDEHELQSYFIQRMEKFLNSKGRRIIGWDEILEGGLAPNATVMSWRGTKGGIAAAKSGHDVIMTPTTHCYFDFYQSDPETEPTAIGGYTPLKKVYHFDPVPTELNEQEAKHILGAQANVWTEYIPNKEHVEYMVFPRLSAMSEVLWGTNKSWDFFRHRMSTQFKRYQQLNINSSKAFYDVQYKSELTADKKPLVTLECDAPNAEIHYTTDGTTPTRKSTLYISPVSFSQSVQITAAAFINGKMVGKPVTKSYLVSKLTGLDYTVNKKNTWFTGGGEFSLTDAVKGNTKVYSQWMGIGGNEDGEITVDMKSVQPVERFSVGLLNAPGLCVMYPTEIKLYGSADGVDYTLIATEIPAEATSGKWEVIRPEMIFPKTEVRYLKLSLRNSGICPANRASGSMIFMDEIGVW